MPTISGINMSYTYGSSEYNELIADADMLPDIEEIQEMMFDETMECINGYDITQGNCNLCDYYMSIDDYMFINFLNEELPKLNDLVMSIFDHFDCLTDDEIIKILQLYDEFGIKLHKIVDNDEDNNNIIILFLNHKKYKVVEELLSDRAIGDVFDSIRNDKNSDGESINSLLYDWKLKMGIEIARYTEYRNADIVNMIIESAFGDIFEKIFTLKN